MNLYSHEKTRELEEERLSARLAIEATLGQPRRRPSMLKIEPGREEEFRYLQRSLLASEQVDRLIAATEPAPELRQLTAQQVATVAAAQTQVRHARTSRRWPLGSIARGVGHALRRMGEAIETWGGARPVNGPEAL